MDPITDTMLLLIPDKKKKQIKIAIASVRTGFLNKKDLTFKGKWLKENKRLIHVITPSIIPSIMISPSNKERRAGLSFWY